MNGISSPVNIVAGVASINLSVILLPKLTVTNQPPTTVSDVPLTSSTTQLVSPDPFDV